MSKVSRAHILFITSLGAFLTPFTSSLISFAVPRIAYTFHSSFSEIVWVPMAYLIALPSFMILMGKMSDTYGRVKFYRLGFVIFIAGGILAAISSSIYFLIITSFIMGFGGALIGVNSISIISTVYPESRRGGALGINAMSVYLGLTFAPFLGGILTQFFTWQFVFLINIPIAIIALALSFRYTNHIDLFCKPLKIDIFGSLIFTGSILSIVLYLSLSQLYGFFEIIYLLVIGLVLLAYFILYEKNIENPMLDISLFTKNRTFSAANFTAFLNYISTFSVVFIFSIYLQVIVGYSPFYAGLILIAEPVFMVIFSPISGKLADKYGSRGIASLGMFLISISFFTLVFLNERGSVLDIVIPLSVLGIGFGLFSAPNTNSVMGSVKKEQFSVAAGTLGTMRFTGQLISLALMSSILAMGMPKLMLLKMFTGIKFKLSVSDVSAFMTGFKIIMLLSGILSLIGAYTSLLRSKKI